MRKTEGFHHPALGHVLGSRLHHHNGVVGTRHDEIQCRSIQIGEGRAQDELIVDQTHAHRANGGVKGKVRNSERRGGAGDREDIGIVLAIRGQQETGHLRFATPATRKQGPQRPIDQATGDDLLLVRPAFPLEEATRDPTRRVEALAIVHRQRQEVDVRPVTAGGRNGGQHDRVAQADGHRSRGLLGQTACFDDQIVVADLCLYRVNQLSCSFSGAGIVLVLPVFVCRSQRLHPQGRGPQGLLPETEGSNQAPIALHIFATQIVQQPPAAAYHAEQSATRGVVLPMIVEMVRQSRNPRSEKRHLNLR